MSDVFISYSARQRSVAQELATELANAGLSVWYDQLLPAGENWVETIDFQLRDAKSVLVLWSADSVRSMHVRAEADAASRQKKRINVVLDDTGLPYDVATEIYLRATGKSSTEIVAGILPAIFELRGGTPRQATQAEPAPQPKNRGFVFLSFCEEDFAFVEELRTFLTSEGFLSWDYSSGDRDVEKLLYLELEAKIDESVVLLCVVSPDWKRSTWSVREYFYAKDIGRPVFIVECRELEPTLAIAGEHRIRFWGERRSAGFELLSRELKRRGL